MLSTNKFLSFCVIYLLFVKLATIIDLLEGSLYGMDLLKLHSVTTKLLTKVDNMEKVKGAWTHTHTHMQTQICTGYHSIKSIISTGCLAKMSVSLFKHSGCFRNGKLSLQKDAHGQQQYTDWL